MLVTLPGTGLRYSNPQAFDQPLTHCTAACLMLLRQALADCRRVLGCGDAPITHSPACCCLGPNADAQDCSCPAGPIQTGGIDSAEARAAAS